MKTQKMSALVKVELKKLYRDPVSLAVILLMPIGLTLIFYLTMNSLILPDGDYRLLISGRDLAAPNTSYFEFLVPGTMGYAIIYMGMMVALGFCAYREAGLLKRIGTTPVSSFEYMGSHIIANVFIGILQAMIVLLLSRFLGFQPQGGLPGLLLAGVFLGLFAATAVGLGLITATVAKSSGAAGGLAVIYIVPMMMFGTFLAVFDETTRTIARFMPNYYVTDSLSVIFNGASLSEQVIWQNLLILAIITLVIVVAGVQIFKKTEYR